MEPKRDAACAPLPARERRLLDALDDQDVLPKPLAHRVDLGVIQRKVSADPISWCLQTPVDLLDIGLRVCSSLQKEPMSAGHQFPRLFELQDLVRQ